MEYSIQIDSLKTQPHAPTSKKLKGEQNLYRNRSGNYRIIYSVIEDKVTICILKIGDRKNVYK